MLLYIHIILRWIYVNLRHFPLTYCSPFQIPKLSAILQQSKLNKRQNWKRDEKSALQAAEKTQIDVWDE